MDSAVSEEVGASAKGIVILSTGNFTSLAVLAVGTILIARLLGPGSYGVFSLALALPNVLQGLIGLGVNSAVVKYVGHAVGGGNLKDAKRYTANAVIFLLMAGAVSAAAEFIFAAPIATVFFGRPYMAGYVQLASLVLLGEAGLQAATAMATAWNYMGISAFATVVQAVGKTVLAPGLILIGFGIGGAIGGTAVSWISASALCVLLVQLKLRFFSFHMFIRDIRQMLGYGAPMLIGTLATILASLYLTITLAEIATNVVVGYYQAASNIVTPLSLLTLSMSMALYPSFARLHGGNQNIGNAFRYTAKYMAYLAAPAVMLLFISSNSLFATVYGPSFIQGARYLQLFCASMAPLILGSAAVVPFMAGTGRPRLTLFPSIGGAILTIVSIPVFSGAFGVYGLILSLIVAGFGSVIIGLIVISKTYKISIYIRPIVGSVGGALAGVIPGYLILSFSFSPLISLSLQIVSFTAVYLTIAPLLGAINITDIEVARKTMAKIPLVGAVVLLLLNYQQKVLHIKDKQLI